MLSLSMISILFCLIFLLSVCFSVTNGDDSIFMQKLASAIHPTPSTWSVHNSSNYCSWQGIKCNLSGRVTDVNLDGRSLSGTIPAEVSTLSELRTLSLQENQFSGAIPSLANLSLLREVFLASNNFENIPQDLFQGLTGLEVFSIGDNTRLAPWSIPADLARCTNLIIFEAAAANVIGDIPDIFSSLGSLQNLVLSYNNLTGVLPVSFANSGIQRLLLDNQETGLSGSINVLSSMKEIIQVWLNNNRLNGSIPDLSSCKNLFDLQLRKNFLTGQVPASLVSLTTLQNVSLSWNNFQGPKPMFPSNMKVENDGNNYCVDAPGSPCDPQVTTLLQIEGAVGYPVALYAYWHGNNACDWRFLDCDQQNRIITVDFSRLTLSGTVASEFSNLTALRYLQLNNNNLTGSIPDSLTSLTELQLLDVSNNSLSGKIPNFASSVTLVTAGNPLLVKNEINEIEKPLLNRNTTKTGQAGKQMSPSIIAGIVVPVIILVTIVLCLFIHCNVKKWYGKSRTDKSNDFSEIQESSSHVHGKNIVFSINVLREVTNNFSEKNILGRGGFGVVYKGQLHNGTKIAVKRMETIALSTKATNGFKAEIKVLTKVRHRHLVALLGYCVHRNEKLLVYEFMPKGTLAQHLFEWCKHGFMLLSWNQRLTIALDVARGIDYLHSLAQQIFIHRDLKPSNILIGDDMRAKVADFGLVKNLPNGKYSLETKLAGTFGYLAPEYAATGKVTRKVDVYAFGAILMEMITGRKAVDETMSDEGWMLMHLVTWFREVLINKEDIVNAIDRTLNSDEETLASIVKVAELAGHCTAPEPHRRPDMSHVVHTLGPLVEHWKPYSEEDGSSFDKNVHNSRVGSSFLLDWQGHEDNTMTAVSEQSSRNFP